MTLSTNQSQNTSRIAQKSYAQDLGCILVWLLILTFAVPLSLASRMAGSVRLAESRQLAEEESDPTGTPDQGEEEPDQLCVVRVNRVGSLACLASRLIFYRPRVVRPKATTRSELDSLPPAELAGRNGSGGPLRC